ncbi:winged helix DNA-binding domain-containing protein [Myxococcus sp. K15C18031901]|uniref:winged helix-turn-helix domain-containing protein n=1 Tax=Myxococcus dinghuensis TaxID=2906761 RepID=UPI0020A80E08|nr:crosslink repair DNA glycosylase YcaQ family protein [Myxococcus dinghuensis]MCP3104670.1 winged helix DNA-binding domain-containing protein [Myxococcus dinghuensis]
MASTSLPSPVTLQPDEARRFLVGQLGLAGPLLPPGARGVRALLKSLRCIQLDPLDVIGTNADLVALARVDGLKRGDVYRHLMPGHAFEHFAKERCLLPASAFPYYREQAATRTPWWSLEERLRRVPEPVLRAVLDEVVSRGPSSPRDLKDHGAVVPIDWSGWKGTARATAMALEVLWARCEVVVCGRVQGGKVYDVPHRALPRMAAATTKHTFERWALLERVEAAGLLSRASGPHWSMLAPVRTSGLPDTLVREGMLEEVSVPGSPRRYLAPRGFRERAFPEPDARMRILGPLDPVLWDRGLVRVAFGFDYIWEVYKPPAQRKWGWYVCPLLHRGRLVGRLEARVREGELQVDNLWREKGVKLDDAALDETLARHAAACGALRVRRPRARVAS